LRLFKMRYDSWSKMSALNQMIMKSNTYLNVVLTLLALGVWALVLQDRTIFPSALAGDPPANFILPTSSYARVPVNEYGKIEVMLDHSTLDVNIVGISTTDELDVNIDEIGGGYVSHGGPLKVELD